MKKTLTFIIALVMCAATLTGCGRSDEEILDDEATAVYNIVEKYSVENPESSKYTLTFSLDLEDINEKLDSGLVEELKKHFGEKQNDYRIAISLSPDGTLDKVKIWFRDDFEEAWSNGDYNAETIIYGEYSE